MAGAGAPCCAGGRAVPALGGEHELSLTLILFSHFDAEPHRAGVQAVDMDRLRISCAFSLLEVYFKTMKGLKSHVTKTAKLKPIPAHCNGCIHSFTQQI